MTVLEEKFIWSKNASEIALCTTSTLTGDGENFSVPLICPEAGVSFTIRSSEVTDFFFLAQKDFFLTVSSLEYISPAVMPASTRVLPPSRNFRSPLPRRTLFPKSISLSRKFLRL